MREVLIFFSVLMLSCIQLLPAQVFKKGNSYAGGSLAFGRYGQTVQIGDKTGSQNISSLVLFADYEYGLLDQVGIGFLFRKNFYIYGDSLNTHSKISNAFLFSNVLHFLNNESLDLYLGMAYGPGFYNHNARSRTTASSVVLKGMGLNYTAFAGIKQLFYERLGVNFGLSYDNFSYEIHTYSINRIDQFKRFRNNYNINYSGMNIFGGINYLLTKK
jgi:hypothetical protein